MIGNQSTERAFFMDSMLTLYLIIYIIELAFYLVKLLFNTNKCFIKK